MHVTVSYSIKKITFKIIISKILKIRSNTRGIKEMNAENLTTG